MLSISHEKLTLSNGLEVILHEDHSLPNVAVNVWYHVGSKDEDIGPDGLCTPVRACDVRGVEAPQPGLL